ncbi:unnamed protein product, partial [Discosporangium mesarthrocarpum]
FTCSDIGVVDVFLGLTDQSVNMGSCTAKVTVVDNSLPQAVCQDITVQLPASGPGGALIAITPQQLDGGSTDNCGITTYSIDRPAVVACADVSMSPIRVSLTVSDASGNSSSCMANVTVEDKVAPTLSCKDFTIQLDASGKGSLTTSDISTIAVDNCSISTLTASSTNFDCTSVGVNTVTLTATDPSGNISTCTS